MIPLFWYRGFANFGDRLSRFIVESVSHAPVRYEERSPKLLALGSILPFSGPGDSLWGTGAWHSKNRTHRKLRVHAVRGPLTAEVLREHGVECPGIYGDPALLLPRYYKPNITKNKGITVMRHYRDDWFPHGADHVLSVTDDPFFVIDMIASSEILVTSTLHGLITAEAYGVPVVLLRNSKHVEIEPQFKYADYFASTGRPDLSCFDMTLEEASKRPLPPPRLPDLERLIHAFPTHHLQRAIS